MRLGLLVLVAALVVPAATAKNFAPGDLRVCNTKACVPIVNAAVLKSLAELYYSGPQPEAALPVALGAPTYELRFRNDYATGIVGTKRLDRFLSYGVHLGHFQRGRWYVVPENAAAELRRLTAKLKPIPLTRTSLNKSR